MRLIWSALGHGGTPRPASPSAALLPDLPLRDLSPARSRSARCAGRTARTGMLGFLVIGLALGCAGSLGTAHAQGANQGAADLPGRQGLDPEIDPYPFDPLFAIRNHFVQALPGGWRAGEPVRLADGYTVVIFVPTGWKGNPGATLQLYCPQPANSMWRNGIRWIEMRPFYKKIFWAGVLCRPNISS